jgi:Ca2+-binding RTX toxin-like protein
MQFISIDTNSEGGQTAEGVAPGSSNGNIDDPQFQWLKAELDAAQAANKLIVLFGHHPVRSMNTPVIDEQAAPCTGGDDGHGHDPNPGCDLDPRASTPIHLGDEQPPGTGETFVELLDRFPNVIAYVPGHTHEHRLTPFTRSDGSLWWELNTSAVVDHPTQSRLIEVFDNKDGTLSIFTNVIDHASDSTAPAAGNAGAFDENELASIGRTLAYNDPQNNFSGDGAVEDRNAELLLGDPRANQGGGGSGPKERCKGKQATIVGTGGKDKLEGTQGDDVIVAKGGKDKVKAGKGDDVVCGDGGKDKLRGNGGKDELRGGGGRDKLGGGGGRDKLKGGSGRDRMRGGGGKDSCGGGPGRDVGRSCEKGRDADE